MSRSWLNTPWDPTVAIDCSYSRAHAAHHVPHPDTGKLICMICHTPPEPRKKHDTHSIDPPQETGGRSNS